MLLRLDIKNLAIVDHVSAQFSRGFNVITGETGAGKSILIKALHLLLGAKGHSDVVRHGAKEAIVCGTFAVEPNHPVLARLASLGFEIDDGAVLLLRRSLNAKGRSGAWINDIPVTAATLREVGECLIDIFAQHDNHRLLAEASHVVFLDAYLGQGPEKAQYQATYQSMKALVGEITALLVKIQALQKDSDYLRFRHKALAQFNPSAEEYEGLKAAAKSADARLEARETLQTLQNRLDRGDGDDSLSSTMHACARLLQKKNQHGALAERFSKLAAEVDDLSYEVSRELEGLDCDEEAIEKGQTRLATYQEMLRKLSVPDVEGLIAVQARFEEELAFLDSAAVQVERSLNDLNSICAKLEQEAQHLHEARTKIARFLESEVRKEFKDLAMPHGALKVSITPHDSAVPEIDWSVLEGDTRRTCERLWQTCVASIKTCKPDGTDRIRFLLTTNPGEDPKPLHKIASGGEISRIMLALKKVLMDEAATCILVFDEIDTGISGRVADRVGQKMRALSTNLQVICISHLAQVAAYADTHFAVTKKGRENEVAVTLRPLDQTTRVTELARLLSGARVTPSSLENARNLLQRH